MESATKRRLTPAQKGKVGPAVRFWALSDGCTKVLNIPYYIRTTCSNFAQYTLLYLPPECTIEVPIKDRMCGATKKPMKSVRKLLQYRFTLAMKNLHVLFLCLIYKIMHNITMHYLKCMGGQRLEAVYGTRGTSHVGCAVFNDVI